MDGPEPGLGTPTGAPIWSVRPTDTGLRNSRKRYLATIATEESVIMRKSVVVIIAAASISLSACGSSASPTPAVTVTATVTPAAPTSASPSTTPTPATPATVTAMGIVDAFVKAGLPATQAVAQTESTDPNAFLGRPGQYTERVSFDIPGGDTSAAVGETDRGGVIELWPSPAEAQARADYIQSVLKGGTILGSEYDYVRGSALVRITGKVLPSVATQFQAALAAMP